MLEKIKEFYKPKLSGLDAFVLHNGEGKRFLSFREDKKEFYLTFGIAAKNEQEAIANGAYAITPQELGKLLFPKEWENGIKQHVLPDERTEAYLTQVKKNIGLLESKYESEGDGLKFEKTEVLPIWFNTCDVEIGKDAQGHWIAEFTQRTDVDSYAMIDFIFDRKPTADMIKTANLLGDIELHFSINGWEAKSFTCWECGRKTEHWLDIEVEGGLEEKWDAFKDKYCGC